MSEQHVQLGEHRLPCYPQKWRRVVNRLGAVLDTTRMTALRAAAGDNALTGAAVIEIVGDRLYYVLCTFIPALPEWLPEHEFNGYASPQAYEQDRYDEAEDKSPTFPQFLDAFDVIVEVNGGKRFLDMLGKVLDWDKIKTSLSTKASEWIEVSSTQPPSLPGTSTESGPTSSTPTSPTSAPADTPESQPASEQARSIESGNHLSAMTEIPVSA